MEKCGQGERREERGERGERKETRQMRGEECNGVERGMGRSIAKQREMRERRKIAVYIM